jgi:signal transduction histidine kinase
MSLRIRLVLLIVVLVALVTVALSAWYLDNLVNSVSADALDRSELASQQVKAFVIDQINRHSAEYETPASLDETRALWNEIVSGDRDISLMLEKMLALSAALVEINIAGQTGEILASSNPSRIGKALAPLELFETWKSRPLYRRMTDLMGRRPDYQVVVPLGFTDQSPPIFTVQVVASMVLLRSGTLLPQLMTLLEVSIGALLVSLFLTVLGTNRVLRPLKHIERTIDRIVQGNYRGEESNVAMAKEFAAVESKLNILGQQFRGAREEATGLQHNLAQVLERMASQLDVASRLAAISRITGGVAHEIKNPLNAISLRLDLLRARLGAPEEELAAEFDILSKEVRRLDRVVKTFLDFSRPVEVRFEELDLAALTREVTELMTPQARLAAISVHFDAPENMDSRPMWIRGDADMLKQAILNLITNALEALAIGGNLRVSVFPAGDFVAVEVSDDGPGICPELRDKVFQLYFTTKSTGSGIGLAMTFRAVQLHNGTIEFTSENGRGTTFRLQFPTLVGDV